MGDRDSKFAVEDVENVPSEPSTEHSISSILRKEPKDSNNLKDCGNIAETKGGYLNLKKIFSISPQLQKMNEITYCFGQIFFLKK